MGRPAGATKAKQGIAFDQVGHEFAMRRLGKGIDRAIDAVLLLYFHRAAAREGGHELDGGALIGAVDDG